MFVVSIGVWDAVVFIDGVTEWVEFVCVEVVVTTVVGVTVGVLDVVDVDVREEVVKDVEVDDVMVEGTATGLVEGDAGSTLVLLSDDTVCEGDDYLIYVANLF